ncbi:MAG: hypothetical protein ACM3XM_15855 [Mycobacterium leprae]
MKRLMLFLAGLSLTGMLLLSGCTPNLGFTSECAFSAPRSANVEIGKATKIRVSAAAGSLQILGRPGLTAVRATGTACAQTSEGLNRIQLKTQTVGDAVEVNVEIQGVVLGSQKLDLTLEVPDNIQLQVTDPSGTATIRQIQSLFLSKGSGETDVSAVSGDVNLKNTSGSLTVSHVLGNGVIASGSGTLTVRDIGGNLNITDKASGETLVEQVDQNLTLGTMGSGTLTVRQIGGEVKLAQKPSGSLTITGVGQGVAVPSLGSGEAYISDVKGSVAVGEKSSGSLTIATVGGSVEVARHSSGTLEVRDVKGDLTVKEKGSGQINTSNIGGKVQVPAR